MYFHIEIEYFDNQIPFSILRKCETVKKKQVLIFLFNKTNR